MSMIVDLATLRTTCHDYGSTAYAVVSVPERSPRVTHVTPTFRGQEIIIGLGSTSTASIAANPVLAMLWPASHDQPMSLIVDCDVVHTSDDGTVRLKAISAVRHRAAPETSD